MNKLQRFFYGTGIAFTILSAYIGLEAFSSSPIQFASEAVAIAYAGRLAGLAVTALAFAVLALVCFKAAELRP